jgi:multidrug efflux pump subunit AcrB
MTTLAFIVGVFPLVVATGAGARSRRALGTPVWGGMVSAMLIGILFVPPLYALFQTMVDRLRSGRRA